MELTMGLPSLPLTWWAGKVGGSTDIGDYQIAHLPPLAASVGAASWAAEYKKYALLRSAFCKTACQHAAAKPINQRIAARNTGAAAGRDVQAIRCTTISIYFGFRGVRGDRFLTYPNRAGSLETCGFKQTFWSLLGLRPKVTRARGRGTFPAGGMQGKRRQVAAAKSDPRSGARNIPFGKRIAGRRGRRPLQCAGTEPRRNERGRGRTSVRQTFPAII